MAVNSDNLQSSVHTDSACLRVIWRQNGICMKKEVMNDIFKIELRMLRFNISQVKAGVSQILLLLNPIRNRWNCLFHTGYFNMDPSLNWKGIWSSGWILKYGFCSSLFFLFSLPPSSFLCLGMDSMKRNSISINEAAMEHEGVIQLDWYSKFKSALFQHTGTRLIWLLKALSYFTVIPQVL